MRMGATAMVCAAGVVAILLAGPALAAEGAPAKFVSAKKCATCHKKKLIGNQYGAWQRSAHARAFEDLSTDRARAVAAKVGVKGDPAQAPQCLECHVTGYGAGPEAFLKGALVLAEGVGCESCHGAGQNFRKKSIMSDLELAKSKGLRIPEDADCRVCHNEKSPTWDENRYVLASGKHVGFDFDLARKKIAHKIPEDVKGHYVEIEKKLRKEKKLREKGR
ncbi:MAG: multiheme c-type cytochrome [Myxococcota bacterium]